MASPTRILFVSDEVAPFTKASATSELARTLPEQLQESGDYEARIMMPRYGTISERRNRLHEVIRLSGTDVKMGGQTHTLKVKVASIPGIRLQVYFMDNGAYFKRKGIYADKQGKTFADNVDRALFFGRSALQTIRKLGWGPEIVHAFGWMSGFMPMLLQTEFADEELFQSTRVVYTPNKVDFEARVADKHVKSFNLPADVAELDPTQVGLQYADAAIYPNTLEPAEGAAQFVEDEEERIAIARSTYDQILSEVPA